MSNNLWDDEQQEEFRDIPDEAKLDSNKQPMVSPPAQVQAPYRPAHIPAEPAKVNPARQQVQPQLDQEDEEFLDALLNDEEDFTAVLNDANLRIEQGRLYQMIMNHNLFEGMDADPRATQNVEREIRKFARERMEIMLGMRQEQSQVAVVSSPFNDLEVDILKKIASKATNGATETEEANHVASVLREAPRKTLNPIGGSTALKRTGPAAPRPQQKLPSKAQAPLQRKRVNATVEQIALEEGVPVEALELEYTGIGKPLNQLSSEELIQRAKETAKRNASRTTVKSASALPMATPEQEQMLAVQRATQIGQSPGMAALLAKVSSMPAKNPG